MKATVLIFLFFGFCFWSNPGFSQKVEYTIKVVNKAKKPVRGATVKLTETSTGDSLEERTNSRGEAIFKLKKGQRWSVAVDEQKQLANFNVEKSRGAPNSLTVYYKKTNGKKAALLNRLSDKPDRSMIVFKEIDHSIFNKMPAYGKGEVGLEIWLHDKTGNNLKQFDVTLVDIKNGIKYLNKTNNGGRAYFKVKGGFVYHIDIGEVEYFQREMTKVTPYGYEGTLEITFQPTNVSFTTRNDTIIQEVKPDQELTSGYGVVKIQMKRGSGPISNEVVWLRNIYTGKVYEAFTDTFGKASFVLPMTQDFMINFEHQPDVDVLRLSRKQATSGRFEFFYYYDPVPKLAQRKTYIPVPSEVFYYDFKYFYKSPPPPLSRNQMLEIFADFGNATINKNTTEALLKLNVVSDEKLEVVRGKPLNLVFVLDISGSMAGYREVEMKKALLEFIKHTNKDDLISIVLFTSSSSVLASNIQGNKRAQLEELILSISSGGGTSIYEGLSTGFELLEKNLSKDKLNKLVLLTDGYGTRTTDELVALAKPYVEKGCNISTVGVGSGYNYQCLKALSSLCGEDVAQVIDASHLKKDFLEKVGSTLIPIGSDLTIEIILNDAFNLEKVYGSDYKKNGNVITINRPNIYHGMNEIALLHFLLENPDPDIKNRPITIKYNYIDGKGIKRSYEKTAKLTWSEKTSSTVIVSEEEAKKLFAIAYLNDALQEVAEHNKNGEEEKSLETIELSLAKVDALYSNILDNDVKSIYDQLKRYGEILEARKEFKEKEEKKKE
jgi:Ca-activated chloride channel family protein